MHAGVDAGWDVLECNVCVFFFTQKTAYEMLRSLVGSEMCIRDSLMPCSGSTPARRAKARLSGPVWVASAGQEKARACLLYTSDAADDLPCVDLGGSRIIKKKIT